MCAVSDLAELEAQIQSAFARGEYPGDWCLTNSREGVEPALLEQEFKGKSDWRALDAGFIDQAPNGYGTALSFFSDEAFRFYLPAYLLADLDDLLRQADVVFVLTHGFDNKSRGERINPRRYGERTWFEHARHKFAVFNAEQAKAIVAYLRYKLAGDTITDFQKSHIREALDNYWAARAAEAP
jgi:uncharacterized protein DUF6714